MNIQIISVGKLSEEMNLIAAKFYKMITAWSVNFHEVPHSKKTNIPEIRQDEGKVIKAKIKANSYLIVLDLLGIQMISEDFSNIFTKRMMDGMNIDFVIGGAFGLDESIIKQAHLRLCLSKMTFPHQFAKILLLEQIYRAQTIIQNHPYHK